MRRMGMGVVMDAGVDWRSPIRITAMPQPRHALRSKLRGAGLRAMPIRVPDTRVPGFAEECRRQSQFARHSEIEAYRVEDAAWEAASAEAISRKRGQCYGGLTPR
jgi:Protein  of unknown function (DUF3018)